MRVAKWGNGLAVRLPVCVVEALAFQEGDDIDVQITSKTRSVDVVRMPGRADLLERIAKYRDRWPADFVFNRDEANDR